MTTIYLSCRQDELVDMSASPSYVRAMGKQIKKKYGIALDNSDEICSWIMSRLFESKLYFDILRVLMIKHAVTYEQLSVFLGKARSTLMSAIDVLIGLGLVKLGSKVLDDRRKTIIMPAITLKPYSCVLKARLDNWQRYGKDVMKEMKVEVGFEKKLAKEFSVR